ncbi:MAG: outer membrane beta-barrel protein [Myxococcota bacterium]
MKRLALAAMLTLFAAAGTVSAQSGRRAATNDGLRVSAGLQFAFGGEIDVGIAEADLDPAVGLQVQMHAPIGDYVLVGGSFAFRSLKVDGFDDRGNLLALGPSVGAHYAVDVGSLVIDPFVLATFGFTIAFENDLLRDTELGIDIGLRFGANLWFTDSLGAYASIGYQGNIIYTDPENISTGQFALDFGIVFSF